MSEPKYANRFPPCPLYDVEGLESWLEDLAGQGLMLTRSGLFCGFAEFEKTEPTSRRYRLQPLPRKKFLEDLGPASAAVELAEAYGWTYLCTMGDFAVYTTEDPEARELDTDLQVQAMALKQLYQRKRNGVIVTAVEFLIVMGLLLWEGPLIFLLDKEPWYLGTFFLIWALYPVAAAAELKRLIAIRRKLSMGEELSRTVAWRKKRGLHWLQAGVSVALLIAFHAAWLLGTFLDWEDRRWQSLAEQDVALPFATMENLTGRGTFRPDGYFVEQDHHMAERSTLLVPRQVKLRQFGEMMEGETVLLEGHLQVDYYELPAQWLAEMLYRELLRADQTSKYYHEMELPELATAQEAAYSELFPTLLLQDGKRVLHVTLSQFSEEKNLPLEQWSAIMAEFFLAYHNRGAAA